MVTVCTPSVPTQWERVSWISWEHWWQLAGFGTESASWKKRVLISVCTSMYLSGIPSLVTSSMKEKTTAIYWNGSGSTLERKAQMEWTCRALMMLFQTHPLVSHLLPWEERGNSLSRMLKECCHIWWQSSLQRKAMRLRQDMLVQLLDGMRQQMAEVSRSCNDVRRTTLCWTWF